MANGKKRKTISEEHRAAITRGRAENAAIAAYLDALHAPKPRGKRRSAAEIKRELGAVSSDLGAETSAARRLALVQRRLDLERELAAASAPTRDEMPALEEGFVAHAATYSERRGITYDAWCAVGVSATMLRRAGIER